MGKYWKLTIEFVCHFRVEHIMSKNSCIMTVDPEERLIGNLITEMYT